MMDRTLPLFVAALIAAFFGSALQYSQASREPAAAGGFETTHELRVQERPRAKFAD